MSKVLIQPGLFKGDYGSHGVELILLTYNEDATKVLGTKVTVIFFNKVIIHIHFEFTHLLLIGWPKHSRWTNNIQSKLGGRFIAHSWTAGDSTKT